MPLAVVTKSSRHWVECPGLLKQPENLCAGPPAEKGDGVFSAKVVQRKGL